jgi:hypothetical protein
MMMEDKIVVDTTLDPAVAVADHKLASTRLAAAHRAEANISCTASSEEIAAAKAEVEAAIWNETVLRVNAQYAIKRVTGMFPYELALSGL